MCGPLLFELKERILGYQGQTSTLGTGRRQGYKVVQSLARLALEGWSHRVLGCDGPVGKEWSAPLGSGPRRGVQTDGGARPEMGTESASEGCGAPPPRARAAGKNAAFELC